jgi:hypothetical protein
MNNNIRRVGIFRKDFQIFKTFSLSYSSVLFNSQKCKRFKKVLSFFGWAGMGNFEISGSNNLFRHEKIASWS